MNVTEEHASELAELARRHGVIRLELFGSAATQAFDSKKSDLDFLVVFNDAPPAAWRTLTSVC